MDGDAAARDDRLYLQATDPINIPNSLHLEKRKENRKRQ